MPDWECNYYQVDERRMKMRTSGEDFAIPDLALCPWCAHPNSKVTRDMAYNTMEGAKLLMCVGNFAACEIGYNGESLPDLPLPDIT